MHKHSQKPGPYYGTACSDYHLLNLLTNQSYRYLSSTIAFVGLVLPFSYSFAETGVWVGDAVHYVYYTLADAQANSKNYATSVKLYGGIRR